MRTILIFILSLFSVAGTAQADFNRYFYDKVLRFDFMFAGNAEETHVYPVGFKEEPFWAGSVTDLTDPFDYGNFKYEILDDSTGTLLYSKGFCTLFQEWQTTDEAKKTDRSYYEVVTMPYPRNRVRFVLSKRQRNGTFEKIYNTVIDPDNYFIRKEKPVKVGVTKIYDAGDPHKSVDLAFIAEGYTADEMPKFRADVKKMADILFAEPPFNDYKDRINIWAVEAVSQESGTDVPGEHIYVNTALNTSYYTFDLDRYLTTQDLKTVNDYAAVVPHDNIIILINSKRYGGGGVYNYYTGTTVDNSLSPKTFIHEFGHGFAGLADEYYTSTVAYNDFYPLDVEPWEPNITTLVDFDSKWKKMISKDTPIPTPPIAKYKDVTGLFEGAGYSAKGIYRAQIDCRMKSNGPDGYCSVCRRAVRKMIEFYLK